MHNIKDIRKNFDNFKNIIKKRNISLDLDTIELGQDISVTNLDTGVEITSFQVKRIRYGRMVKMCWLGETEGINEGTYITVGGCKQK